MRMAGWKTGAAAIAVLGATAGMIATSGLTAQDAPESLLPPGFDDPSPPPPPEPAPPPTPTPPPASQPSAPSGSGSGSPRSSSGSAVVQPIPDAGQSDLPSVPRASQSELSRLPTIRELEELSTAELDELLGLTPKFDIPPASRRSLSQVGLLDPSENGFPTLGLARQPEELVQAVLSGTKGPLVSRWGHILLRRVLASRMTAPEGMDPVDFAALRVRVLNSIGEFAVARALAQDVDTENWGSALTTQALQSYIATSDIAGACPAVRLTGAQGSGPRWTMLQAICNAFAGESALAGSQLDRALSEGVAPDIDVLLAQRYAGAAGRGRRAVAIEWDDVDELTPWRFSLANAVGETVPDNLLDPVLAGESDRYYSLAAATAPMIALEQRAVHARTAASAGVLSSNALIDIYSQVHADLNIGGDIAERAALLREAYVLADPLGRIDAMRQLWNATDAGFASQILTAYASARIPPSDELALQANELIASMLTAGLDRDAAAWRNSVEEGSPGWALIALADPDGDTVSEDAVDTFVDEDNSAGARRSAFLIAGLAGLGRLSDGDFRSMAGRLEVDFSRRTRWTRTISRAAEVDNPALVALLAGLGMQGESWEQMTPLHLYHIVSALERVGLDAEARMIAAEAVARV